MNPGDPELLATFDKLGIICESETIVRPSHVRRKWADYSDESLRRIRRTLAERAPESLIAEMRRRGLR
jgi:hypothetical protein